MPRNKTVTLGGVSYEIAQLPMRANREWREKLGAPITQLITMLGSYQDIKIDSAADLAQIVSVAKDLLLGSMDMLLGALFEYSPVLAADRERIENEAYDDEAIAALGVAVSLAYPLDMALRGLMRGGLPVTPTSTKSPSPNGGNGTKLPTAGPRRSTTRT